MLASTPLPHGSWFAWGVLMALVRVALLLDLAGLPGLWLIVLGAIGYAWGTGFAYVGGATIGLAVGAGLGSTLSPIFAPLLLASIGGGLGFYGIEWNTHPTRHHASRTTLSTAKNLIGIAMGAIASLPLSFG